MCNMTPNLFILSSRKKQPVFIGLLNVEVNLKDPLTRNHAHIQTIHITSCQKRDLQF